MSGILDRILELLSIGTEAHSLEEISSVTGLSPIQVEKAIMILTSIEFISFDGKKGAIDPVLKQLFLENGYD